MTMSRHHHTAIILLFAFICAAIVCADKTSASHTARKHILDKFDCSNRYDLHSVRMGTWNHWNTLNDTQRQAMWTGPGKALAGCEVAIKNNKICGMKISATFEERPPYAFLDKKTGKVNGIIPGMLQKALDACCYGCNSVTYVKPATDLSNFFQNQNVTMHLPVQTTKETKRFGGFDYIYFIKVPGVQFLTSAENLKPDPTAFTRQLFQSVLNTWPLFIVAFLMALIAGCVVWALDTWFNKEDFPNSFPRGPFEGFWWAFVSMTTVGYGDRSPKSVSARLFAIMWILLGITMFSMYTASLTSALTSAISATKVTIYGKTIAVLSTTSVSRTTVLLANAIPKQYGTVEEMAEALANNEVFAIALDDNIARHFEPELNATITDVVMTHHERNELISYGIMSFNSNVTIFLRTFMESNDDMRLIMASEVSESIDLKENIIPENTQSSSEFFSTQSPMFVITIGILLGIGLGTVAIGLLLKWLCNKGVLRKYRPTKCVTNATPETPCEFEKLADNDYGTGMISFEERENGNVM